MKSRTWCFTLNNYDDGDIELLRSFSDCRYLIVGEEVGENGTKHLQGYFYFNNPRALGGVREILNRAHWEIAKGNPQQNYEYCKKDGKFFEFGTLPMSQKRKGEIEQERWKDAIVKAKSGRLEEISPDIFFRYYKTCKEIKKDYMAKPEDLEGLDNYWIWGPPGAGKSFMARQRFPDAYFKAGNKWWDGYQGEENVIIDDFELDFKVLGHHLKIWADRYSFIAECKGGAMHIRPKRIIVTSNYTIDNVFCSDQRLVEAVYRRFTVEWLGPQPTAFADSFVVYSPSHSDHIS